MINSIPRAIRLIALILVSTILIISPGSGAARFLEIGVPTLVPVLSGGDFNCGEPATLIHTIQGNADSSPEIGNIHVIEGVVVGDFQDTSSGLSGYFVQEEDSDADGDPLTSEGIFVYDNGFGVQVNPGDVVRLQGQVDEYFELTELKEISATLVCPGIGTATPISVNLPVSSVSEWERYEGMLVSIPQTLYATDHYRQGQFGEVELSINSQLFNPTSLVSPGTAANDLQNTNNRSRIQIDDGSRQQNPLPLPPYLGQDNTLRAGDSIPGVTGVLSYSFDRYEIHPTQPLSFTRLNPRPTSPGSLPDTLKIASFNVLNYFTTIDTGVPICGPSGDLECRGADSAVEFTRQRDKIIQALLEIDADIVGLIEIENNATTAVQDLVDGLNALAGASTYAYIDTGTSGMDAIKLALVYKPGSVTPIGSHAILDSSVDPSFLDALNRPSLAQTFRADSGDRITVAVNHFKSKASACDHVGDPDQGDGQGNCNLTRTNAAIALASWLANDPTGSGDADFLIIGDLNAYAMEDPITALESAGYTDLIERYVGSNAYSYIFDGQAGYLDHALANPSLLGKVVQTLVWHINADEPRALDYNDYNQPDLYSPDEFRSSDHDPLMVCIQPGPANQLYLPIIKK